MNAKWERKTTSAVKRNDIGEKDRLAYAVVIAACLVGANRRRVAREIGVSEEEIKTHWNRLKQAGVFRRGYVVFEDPDNPQLLAIEICLLVCVAQGLIKRKKEK